MLIKNARATQEFIPVKEIRDGILVLKSGELRAVVLASSINLSLKSNDEQKATIMQFQSFLNTLDFPIQMSVQSRRLDIRPYLLQLENRLKVQNEPLLKLQTKEYIEFIKNFTDTVSIMTKNFYVVVPYIHTGFKADTNIFKKLFGNTNKKEERELEQMDFEEKRSQIQQRVGVIEQGLSRCGIKSVQLDTEAMVEMFYKVFNPGELEGKIELE